jgi:hypothetical protein
VAHPYDLHKARFAHAHAHAHAHTILNGAGKLNLPLTTHLQVRDQKTMRQLHAPPILTSLQHFLPDGAYCLLAFTMEDLYDGQRVRHRRLFH